MKAIRVYLILVATILFSSIGQIFSQANGEESFSEMEAQILKLVNEHRKSIGLNELQYNKFIHAEALNHSKNMANEVVPFSHDGFDGRYERLIKKIGGSSMAENVANGQSDAESVVASWLESTGHKQNIEGNYNLTGIGIARGKDGELFFTQIFLWYKPIKK